MEYKVYTVFDAAVQSYMQPFYAQAKGQAIRMFADSVNDPSHMFAKHPDDYTLFELGVYNDEDASFTMHLTPMSLGVAIEFKRGSNE